MSESTQRTLVIVKPDGVRNGHIGDVISRIEKRGFIIEHMKMMTASKEMLEEHYREHRGKPFFDSLVEFMGSGPVVPMIVEGHHVIESFRAMAGATDPKKAQPGSIRGDLSRDWGTAAQQNCVHGSDSPHSAEREIALWFASELSA